jgi:uncharacterized protein (TIGR00369 family)
MENKFFGLHVPFIHLLGLRGERFDAGITELVLDSRPELTNHYGQVHGGVLTTMLDVAMASAARSLHPQSPGSVTVSLSSQFLRPGVGTLRATGRVRQSGRSLVFCEAEIQDEQAQVVATSIGTFKVLRTKPA